MGYHALRVDSSEMTTYKRGSDFEKRRRAKTRMKNTSITPWRIDEFQRREMTQSTDRTGNGER
jgi:hypothetical protein